jgi:peptide/nickel transport system substrate-binding protein
VTADAVRLTRNRYFHVWSRDARPDGYPDEIRFHLSDDADGRLAAMQRGDADWVTSLPAGWVKGLLARYGARIHTDPAPSTDFMFLNTRVPPFNDVTVRRAVNYAINRDALVRVYGGLAQPTENVLPPTYPQYKKITMYTHDVAKAKQLVKSAGATGAAVTVWGNNDALSSKSVQYLSDVLNSIGLKSTPKIIDPGVYWTTIGNQKTKAQIGFADWYQDYPHPLDWFEVLLYGPRITETHNNNYSNADDPQVNKMIADLKKEPTLNKDVNSRWAEVDKRVAEQALWIPYYNLQATAFYSSRVDTKCHYSHVLYQVDWYLICLK